tara:strand:- start:40815 stop:41009 length:195 start_codon:yes stop_codon:yes gene_type:complete
VFLPLVIPLFYKKIQLILTSSGAYKSFEENSIQLLFHLEQHLQIKVFSYVKSGRYTKINNPNRK